MSALIRHSLICLLLGAAITPSTLVAQPRADLAAGARVCVHVAPSGER